LKRCLNWPFVLVDGPEIDLGHGADRNGYLDIGFFEDLLKPGTNGSILLGSWKTTDRNSLIGGLIDGC
jgi:hypothetical protein